MDSVLLVLVVVQREKGELVVPLLLEVVLVLGEKSGTGKGVQPLSHTSEPSLVASQEISADLIGESICGTSGVIHGGMTRLL